MRKTLFIAALWSLGLSQRLLSDASNTTPPVSDVGTEDDVRRSIRRMSENVLPRTGGDTLTYRDVKNSRVGIGTDTPACTLDVVGNICGTTALTVGSVTATTATISSATITTLNAAITHYSPPDLIYIATGTVDITTNTGTANRTCILFPDGDYRCVTENTATTNKYRRFIITDTANYTSGTEDSGLKSTFIGTNDTFYWIYAVKSQINTANYILEGTTTPALSSNYSTLDGLYGTNGWVYIGKIRYGDNSGVDNDIVAFVMHGPVMIYNSACTAGSSGRNGIGLLMANATSASSLDFTFTTGVTGKVVPSDVTHWWVSRNINVGSTGVGNMYQAAAVGGNSYTAIGYSTNNMMQTHLVPAGINVGADGPAGSNFNFYMYGYYDGALGGGSDLPRQ